MVLVFAAGLQRAMMDFCMRITTIESQFVSVERCVEYTRIHPEEIVEAPYLPSNWPSRGSIELKGVSMRYHLARPLVLRGLCLSVPSRAKVAICGRTGCGKSSLFQVLTGLYGYSYGTVQIDGIELCSVPLPILRKSVRCISQQSAAVSGTLRDHFGETIPEPFIWRALDKVGMSNAVRALPNKLDEVLNEDAFSAGERQLIALAQGLLEGDNGMLPKIFLFDEATASVDVVTDNLIHDVVLGLDATVLAIMHRLQHVQRFDKVVILDKGAVVEDGPPHQLMRDINSRLYTLCKKAGIEKQSNGGTLSPSVDRGSMSRSMRSNGSNARSVMSKSGSKRSPRMKPRAPPSPPPGA